MRLFILGTLMRIARESQNVNSFVMTCDDDDDGDDDDDDDA